LQRILLLPSFAVCQLVFFRFSCLVMFNDHLYALFDIDVLGLPR
jgi:hypothetical protein